VPPARAVVAALAVAAVALAVPVASAQEAPPTTDTTVPPEGCALSSPADGSEPVLICPTTTAAPEVPTETTVPVTEPAPESTPVETTDPALEPAPEPDEPAPTEPVVEPGFDERGLSTDYVLRDITFPALGRAPFSNDWGNCRDACARFHKGNDLFGVKLQPLVAARDGVIDRVFFENGNAGNGLALVDDEGWTYLYLHVNNDEPGTDSGGVTGTWTFPVGIAPGTRVVAGQVIGWMGDSGNSEDSEPHLHFEMHDPDGTPVNPYFTLVRAQDRGRCFVSLMTPEDAALAAAMAAPPLAMDLAALGALSIVTRDGAGAFTVTPTGLVFADGDASSIGNPNASTGDCAVALAAPVVPEPEPELAPEPELVPEPEPLVVESPAPEAPVDPAPADPATITG
jgi:hypothetical protein